MKNELYQQIFNELQKVLPKEWSSVVFYAEYSSGSYSMKYYVKNGTGKFTDCYKLSGLSKAQIVKTFIDLDKIITPVRKELPEKDKWSIMTMILDSKGEFKVEFDYTDISENSIIYKREWEKKYIDRE